MVGIVIKGDIGTARATARDGVPRKREPRPPDANASQRPRNVGVFTAGVVDHAICSHGHERKAMLRIPNTGKAIADMKFAKGSKVWPSIETPTAPSAAAHLAENSNHDKTNQSPNQGRAEEDCRKQNPEMRGPSDLVPPFLPLKGYEFSPNRD